MAPNLWFYCSALVRSCPVFSLYVQKLSDVSFLVFFFYIQFYAYAPRPWNAQYPSPERWFLLPPGESVQKYSLTHRNGGIFNFRSKCWWKFDLKDAEICSYQNENSISSTNRMKNFIQKFLENRQIGQTSEKSAQYIGQNFLTEATHAEKSDTKI